MTLETGFLNGKPELVYSSTTDNTGTALGSVFALLCVSDEDFAKITYVDTEGNTITDFPLVKGYNPIAVTKVTAVSADVTELWAVK